MELSEKKKKNNQVIMMKEIEDFIEKNMNEMHKALDELRISFEDEIEGVNGIYYFIKSIEEVYPDVVRLLKEDMEMELENLKEQYEEQRRETVEKIKKKYEKK